MTEFEAVVEVLTKIIPYIVSLAIGGIGGWKIVKTKLTKIVEVSQKLLNFLVTLKEAAEDETITEAEFQKTWADGQELIKSFGELIGFDLSYVFTSKRKKK
jgi:hypothetical protein